MSDSRSPKKSEKPARKKASGSNPKARPGKRSRAPRPDEMTRETFEFVAAVDQYRRDQQKSFLDVEDVLEVLNLLSYVRPDSDDPVADYEAALESYKEEHGRLFPNWSEVFEVVRKLGYRSASEDAAA